MRSFCRRQNSCLSGHSHYCGMGCAASTGHHLPLFSQLIFPFSLWYLFPPLLWKRRYYIFSSAPSKILCSKNGKHFKCQQDLLKHLQSKQSSTLSQEENSGTKYLNEGSEPHGESVAYLERGSRVAEHLVFGTERCLCKVLHQGIFTAFPKQQHPPEMRPDPHCEAHH